MGLNITVMSLDGQLDVGIVADREQMPDVARLVGWLGDELSALMPAAPKRRPRRRAQPETAPS
jgi:diacylglycerol O-acyltransferase / wax synthase